MKLTNTLTRQKEDFKPLKKGEVTLYTCGPTVYDYAHIGNLRGFTFYDLLRRTLEQRYRVKHVMNITDVGHLVSDADEGEDKLEKGARREGKTVWQVAEQFTNFFKTDVSTLNILAPNGYSKSPDGLARATDFVDQQIEMVKILLAKNFAYQTTQAIYFDVTKLPDYGKLSGQNLKDKEVGARNEVITDPDKGHPYDFAVWFFTVGHFQDHSMRWPTPWGDGFPGWHLECSAIIHSTLGEPIDIHAGGIDHIGTHHTNEIAQTEAAYGVPLANIWLHNEFMQVDGAKMSKSKGNFYRLQDIIDRGYSPLAFRLLCLSAHYRSQLNFTWASLEAAQNTLTNLYSWADRRHQPYGTAMSVDFAHQLETAKLKLTNALFNDLDSPTALAIISQLANQDTFDQLSKPAAKHFQAFLEAVEQALGLGLMRDRQPNASQVRLIDDREEARAAEDFVRSDQLRAQLQEQGIGVDDTPLGPRWRRLKP